MGASCLISSAFYHQQFLDHAFSIYYILKKSEFNPNSIVYFSLVNACRQFGAPAKALQILQEMNQVHHDIRYDSVIMFNYFTLMQT